MTARTWTRGPSWIIVVVCFPLLGCTDDEPARADVGTDAAADLGGADAGPDAPPPDGAAADGPRTLRAEVILLHTNDLHGHLMGAGPILDYTPATTGDDATRGGFARLATLVADERTAAGDTPLLLLDAGDFTMGTPFSALITSHAAELTEMQAMGYDAIAFGNHEFDWGPEGLAAMIERAQAGGFDVPLLATNVILDGSAVADDGLEALEQSGAIRRKLVKTLGNGLKVGLFSLVGEIAASDAAPTAGPVRFEPIAEAAQAAVAELRDVDAVDLVIALSHSGVLETRAGEDAELAKAVPGIDVIVSGHTHTVLEQAVKVGRTWIVQTGDFGRNLGRVALQVYDDGTVDAAYTLLAVDDAAEGDAAVQARIEGYIAEIDNRFAPRAYREVVAEVGFDLVRGREHPLVELPLGNLVTDAYVAAVSALEPAAPAEVAIESPGALRDPLLKGETGQLTFADLYRVVSIGSGPDGDPGFPLVSFYVTGAELKIAAEVTAVAGDLGLPVFFLQFSGMKFTFDRKALLFNRVTEMSLADGTPIDATDTTKCYRIVVSQLIAGELDRVGALTGGAMKIVPKEQDCVTVVGDVTARIVDADPAAAGVQELKQREALLRYVRSLPDADGDGTPELPARYAQAEGRIVAK